MRQEGKSGCIQLCKKGSRQSEHQRSGIKLRNVAFYVLEEVSLWAHWIHSFHVHLGYLGSILFPCSSCFLHSPSSWESPWERGVSASTGLQFGQLSFTFGGQKSLMAVTFVVYWYSGDIFISPLKHLIKNILTIFLLKICGYFVCYISSLAKPLCFWNLGWHLQSRM